MNTKKSYVINSIVYGYLHQWQKNSVPEEGNFISEFLKQKWKIPPFTKQSYSLRKSYGLLLPDFDNKHLIFRKISRNYVYNGLNRFKLKYVFKYKNRPRN